jgi:hypothetical protein
MYSLFHLLKRRKRCRWNGGSNGWYIYGIFDTGNRTLLEENYHAGNGNYSTGTIVWIVRPS